MKNKGFLVNSKPAKYVFYAFAFVGAIPGFIGGLSLDESIALKVFAALVVAFGSGAGVALMLYIPALFVEAIIRDISDKKRVRLAKWMAYNMLGISAIRIKMDHNTRPTIHDAGADRVNRETLNEILDILGEETESSEAAHLLKDLFKLEKALFKLEKTQGRKPEPEKPMGDTDSDLSDSE